MGKKIIWTLFLLGFFTLGFSQELFNKGIQLNLLNGDKLLFDNYKGKLIVLNIWGTWCAPCVGELPLLNNLADKYKSDSSIVFIAITNENKDRLTSFFKTHIFNYTQVINGSRLIDEIQKNDLLKLYPTSLIIDNSGKIRYKKRGVAKKIDELLAKEIEKLRNK